MTSSRIAGAAVGIAAVIAAAAIIAWVGRTPSADVGRAAIASPFWPVSKDASAQASKLAARIRHESRCDGLRDAITTIGRGSMHEGGTQVEFQRVQREAQAANCM